MVRGYSSESENSCDAVDALINALVDPLFFNIPEPTSKRAIRGPVPLHERHPCLLSTIEEFLTQHGSAAHNRRRDNKQFCHGVSLQQIRAHILRCIPELKHISVHTIHRYLLPPNNRNRNSADRYMGLIEAKVPAKRNNMNRDEHIDTVYCRAYVKTIMEFGQKYSREVVLASSDIKKKLNVGTLAVSRLYKHRRFFLKNDAPNYADHDFPYRDAKIVPAGYKRLTFLPSRSRSVECSYSTQSHRAKRRARSLSPSRPKSNIDERGRRFIPRPCNGPLDLHLYAQRHHDSTQSFHSKFLRETVLPKWLRFGESVLINNSDGGPDWNGENMINVFLLGRLWKEAGLDCLINTTYAPNDSKMNPIERCWSHISHLLTGVILPVTLLGEDRPPWQQTEIPLAQRNQKSDQVFHNANEICRRYIHNRKYGGFPIHVHADRSDGSALKEEHDDLKAMLNSVTKSKLESDDGYKELQKEYQFLMKHCIRLNYYVQFSKCSERSCEHCTTHPVKAKGFMAALRMFGGYIPSPVESAIHKGRYITLEEMWFQAENNPCTNALNDMAQMQPSITSRNIQRCGEGCAYMLMSHADARRHYLWMGHSAKPPDMAKRKRVVKQKYLTQ